MAVYKRNYSAYTGEVTSGSTRVLVLARYAFAEAWQSKITVAIFIFSLLPCIIVSDWNLSRQQPSCPLPRW